MGSRIGILKIAAKRLGLTLDEYQSHISKGLKWCWACQQWKSKSLFACDSSRGDRLSAKCRECRRPSRTKPSLRKRREKRDEGLSWCCECKLWFPISEIRNARCRPCRNIYARRRYATNARYREERKNHRDKHRRGIERVPPEGREILLEYSEGLCVYCGDIATTWDHIVPVSKEGKTTPGNIVPCCISCNSSKKDKDVLDWIDEKGLEPIAMLYERIELSAME